MNPFSPDLRHMPLDSQHGARWPEPLASRLGADAGTDEVAGAFMAVWHEIDAAMSPIIGQRGVAALFHRSLKLVSAAHTWLSAGRGSALDAVDPAALEAMLLLQTAAEAAEGGAALFQSFHDLLSSLVGAALTNRLLHSVWTSSAGDTPAQDLLP